MGGLSSELLTPLDSRTREGLKALSVHIHILYQRKGEMDLPVRRAQFQVRHTTDATTAGRKDTTYVKSKIGNNTGVT